jgi:hypothetical protein
MEDFTIYAEDPPTRWRKECTRWTRVIEQLGKMPRDTWYVVAEYPQGENSAYSVRASLRKKYQHVEFRAVTNKENKSSKLYARVKGGA